MTQGYMLVMFSGDTLAENINRSIKWYENHTGKKPQCISLHPENFVELKTAETVKAIYREDLKNLVFLEDNNIQRFYIWIGELDEQVSDL